MPAFEENILLNNKLPQTPKSDPGNDSDIVWNNSPAQNLFAQTLSIKAPPKTKPATTSRELPLRVRTQRLCVMTRQLATLLHAGMPLVPALTALVDQLNNDPLGLILEDIREKVNAGATLADALTEHKTIFSHLYINMVRAGEAGGTLEAVLLKLADLLEKRLRLTAKVKAAVVYPSLMAAAAVAVVFFLMAFVIPGLTKIFLEMNHQLPWPTTLLIAVSSFLKQNFIYMILLVLALVAGVRLRLKNEHSRMAWDRLKLRLPLFGKLFIKVEASRLTRTLGILLASGVTILKAMEICLGISQNHHIAQTLKQAKEDIERGDTIAQAIKNTNVFPPIMFHMIATGEVSGHVEKALLDISDAYDNEIENATRALTSLIEPVVLLAMGAVVGFIVLAVLLPIFEINQML